MNLLLIRPSDTRIGDTLTVNDYRAEHMLKVLKVKAGDQIQVGELNGAMGQAEVRETDNKSVTLALPTFTKAPPATLNCEVILALPRPRMLQRSLQTLATMGVDKIHLVQTERVEKSFWQTPLLKPSAIEDNLILGLEQAKATQMPAISLYRKWPEVRELIHTLKPLQKVIAHPGNYPEASLLPRQSSVLAIGPEGGFTPREVSFFCEQGFLPVSLGGRILRVETAVPVLLSKLFNLA